MLTTVVKRGQLPTAEMATKDAERCRSSSATSVIKQEVEQARWNLSVLLAMFDALRKGIMYISLEIPC